MENIEKATEQLSGRVTESQKKYFQNIDGSFTEKVAELIELHKNKIDNDLFTISPNLDAIQKAINTIVKNVECIESNTNTYVEDFNNSLSSKIAILENDSIELKSTREENIELQKSNQIVLEANNKLQIENESLKRIVENREHKISSLVENNNQLLEYKLGIKEEIHEIKLEYKNKIENLQKEISSKDNDINNLEKKVLLEENKTDTLKEKIDEYKVTIEENKKRFKEDHEILNNKIDVLIQQVQDSKLDKQRLEIELTNKLDNKQLELEMNSKLIDDLKKELETLTKQIQASKKISKTQKD